MDELDMDNGSITNRYCRYLCEGNRSVEKKDKNNMKQQWIQIIKNEATLFISTLVAILSMYFVHPNSGYLDYIDFKVISLLFCLMVVVAGLIKINFFALISEKLLEKSKSCRMVAFLLTNCTFFFAMLITNDVALITMIPLTIGVLKEKPQNTIIFVIVVETIAANLGSMLTPIGNPQNLYLYSFYQLDIGSFLQTVLPIGLVSYCLIVLTLYFMPKTDGIHGSPLSCKISSMNQLKAYVFLFGICLVTVLRILDYRICFFIVLLFVLIMDWEVLKTIDYSLLLTFFMFFIFVGNLGTIESVKTVLSQILSGRELLLGILTSQLVSNVPAAIMLSGFTENAKQLLLGVNIGGLGTLIASLASLISFRIYAKSSGARIGKYFWTFTGYNIFILVFLFVTANFLY